MEYFTENKDGEWVEGKPTEHLQKFKSVSAVGTVVVSYFNNPPNEVEDDKMA